MGVNSSLIRDLAAVAVLCGAGAGVAIMVDRAFGGNTPIAPWGVGLAAGGSFVVFQMQSRRREKRGHPSDRRN